MIDKLYINGVDIEENFGFFLKWRTISFPVAKTEYVDIPGADSSVDLTEANGRVFYEMRYIDLGMVHPKDEYILDVDSLSRYNGEKVTISFESDAARYFSGRLHIEQYNKRDHDLVMRAEVYPYKFNKEETVYTVKRDKSIVLVNDVMPVTPKIEVTGSATLAWKTYTQMLSDGTYYVDGLRLGKFENLILGITLGENSSVRISYRKGRL